MAQEDENERGRGANARMRFRQSAGQERENVRKASRSMRLLIAVDAVLFLAILIAGGMRFIGARTGKQNSIFLKFRHQTGIPRIF